MAENHRELQQPQLYDSGKQSGLGKPCAANGLPGVNGTLQIILELCIPEKELARARSQISFIYFQSHSWYSVRNYKIPKEIMKTRFEPRLPRMSSWKKLHTLDLNSGPLHKWQVFCNWTINADTKYSYLSILIPVRTTKDCHSCQSLLLVWQICSLKLDLCEVYMYLALMFQCQNTYNWCRGPGCEV